MWKWTEKKDRPTSITTTEKKGSLPALNKLIKEKNSVTPKDNQTHYLLSNIYYHFTSTAHVKKPTHSAMSKIYSRNRLNKLNVETWRVSQTPTIAANQNTVPHSIRLSLKYTNHHQYDQQRVTKLGEVFPPKLPLINIQNKTYVFLRCIKARCPSIGTSACIIDAFFRASARLIRSCTCFADTCKF